jgi:hypothetical protein
MSAVDYPSERDAEKVGASLDKTDAPTLGLSSHDDVRNLFGDSEEMRHNWAAPQGINWAKQYSEGNLEIVLRFHIKRGNEIRDLVFLAIPFLRNNSTARVKLSGIDFGVSTLQSGFGEQPVLAAITKAVENPDGTALPSFVRFESPKEREDLRWKVFTAASAYHVRFELRGGIGNREVSGFRFPFPREDGGLVSQIIKRSPQMLDGLNDEEIKFGGCVARQAAFVSLCKTVRIRLGKENIWPTLEESAAISFERIEVLFCAPDPDFSAQEWFRHRFPDLV